MMVRPNTRETFNHSPNKNDMSDVARLKAVNNMLNRELNVIKVDQLSARLAQKMKGIVDSGLPKTLGRFSQTSLVKHGFGEGEDSLKLRSMSKARCEKMVAKKMDPKGSRTRSKVVTVTLPKTFDVSLPSKDTIAELRLL